MSKRVKDLICRELRGRYESLDSAVVVDPTGIDAITADQVRRSLRERSVRMEVVKNSLARRALVGSRLEPIRSLLTGPSALVTGGESIVEAVKALAEWGKKVGRLKLRGAVVEGQLLDEQGAAELALLPGKGELQGQVAGAALSAGRRLAGAMVGPARIIAGCVRAIIERAEAGSGA